MDGGLTSTMPSGTLSNDQFVPHSDCTQELALNNMDTTFRVSVITPVYNAERFLRRSVEASLRHDCVGEVILVEDGSPDNAISLCHALAKEDQRVRLLQHPNGENRGAGASRNLGLREAKFPFVAFADADDYFLPNRFDVERELLPTQPSLDGVYGAVDSVYDSEEGRLAFEKSCEGPLQKSLFLTISEACPPEELLDVWLGQHPRISGAFATDAVTVRRSLLEKSGYFREDLPLQQDTDLFIRFCAVGRLVSGIIDRPVAMRGIHSAQRMTNVPLQAECTRKRLAHLRTWFKENIKSPAHLKAFERHYWCWHMWNNRGVWAILPTLHVAKVFGGDEIKKPYGLIDQGLRNILGESVLSKRLLSLKRKIIRPSQHGRP